MHEGWNVEPMCNEEMKADVVIWNCDTKYLEEKEMIPSLLYLCLHQIGWFPNIMTELGICIMVQ